jgi:peptidoglycan/xylan/chitin deacetylase (PgdA/CDA1 family)
MNWDQVGKLIENGHSIGLHGHTHRDFAKMSANEVTDEFETSISVFKRRLGVLPDCFAYPFGQFQHRRADMRALIEPFKIRYVFTTDHRLAHLDDLTMPMESRILPRLRVDATDSPIILSQKIRGDWDYIAKLQRIKASLAMRSFRPVIRNDR